MVPGVGVRRMKDDSCIVNATKVIQQVQEEMQNQEEQVQVVSQTDLDQRQERARAWM